MDQKMNVLKFKETGHILGAVSINSQKDKQLTVEDIAYQGLALRSPETFKSQLTVASDLLSVSLTNFNESIFYRPMFFSFKDTRPEQQIEWSDTDIANALSLDGNEIAVTLPANTVDDIDVWVQVSGELKLTPDVVKVSIAQNTKNGTAELNLRAGDYVALVMAPGYSSILVEASVP